MKKMYLSNPVIKKPHASSIYIGDAVSIIVMVLSTIGEKELGRYEEKIPRSVSKIKRTMEATTSGMDFPDSFPRLMALNTMAAMDMRRIKRPSGKMVP